MAGYWLQPTIPQSQNDPETCRFLTHDALRGWCSKAQTVCWGPLASESLPSREPKDFGAAWLQDAFRVKAGPRKRWPRSLMHGHFWMVKPDLSWSYTVFGYFWSQVMKKLQVKIGQSIHNTSVVLFAALHTEQHWNHHFSDLFTLDVSDICVWSHEQESSNDIRPRNDHGPMAGCQSAARCTDAAMCWNEENRAEATWQRNGRFQTNNSLVMLVGSDLFGCDPKMVWDSISHLTLDEHNAWLNCHRYVVSGRSIWSKGEHSMLLQTWLSLGVQRFKPRKSRALSSFHTLYCSHVNWYELIISYRKS